MKMFLSCFILMMSWPTISLSSRGPFSLSEQYRQSTRDVLLHLKDMDVELLACAPEKGCLTPDILLNKLNSIDFVELPTFQKESKAKRWGAFFSAAGNGPIYLNKSQKHLPEMRGYIGIHELLGVMDRPEPNFEMTMIIYQLLNADPNDRPHISKILSAPQIKIDPNDPDSKLTVGLPGANQKGGEGEGNSGGGVVVNGGSGDTRTLQLRIAVYKKLRSNFKNLGYMDLYFFSAPIEFTKDPKVKTIEYVLRGHDMEYSILVPEFMLENGQAIDDIVWFIRSLYPEQSGIPTVYLKKYHLVVPKDFKDIHPAVFNQKWDLVASYVEECLRRN